MSAATTPPARRYTPDDLLQMPDGGRYELIDGQLKERNVSAKSSYVAGRVFRALDDHVEATSAGWVFPPDASFRCFPFDDSRVRRPDGAFVRRDRLTADQYEAAGHIPVCPDLVVEVISPNDLAADAGVKVEEWLSAGVRLLWLINPDARVIDVFDADGGNRRLREKDTLTGNGLLPGFAVPVANLFRTPVS